MSLATSGAATRLFARGRLPPWDVAAALVIGALTASLAFFGINQLVQTVDRQLVGPADVTDFLAIYSGARLLLFDPSHLYAPGAAAALERVLSAGNSFDRPFSFMPSAALLLAPLGLLDIGTAYAVWLAINLLSLAAATFLLAPRRSTGWGGQWLLWFLVVVAFLPAQFGLIMGQTSSVALLAFAVFGRAARHQRWAGLVLGASPVAWKPQLLPCLLVAFAAGRRWWTAAWLMLPPVVLSGAVLVIAGPSLVIDYRANSSEMWNLVSQRVWYEFPGQSLLGLFQSLVEPGPFSFVLYVFGVVGVVASVGRLWWRGLRSDARVNLQLAALPIAAVLVAPHALVYELTTWLASAWLLMRYAQARPDARAPIHAVCLVGWATANIDTLTERSFGLPLAAVAGVAALGLIVWLDGRAATDKCRESR